MRSAHAGLGVLLVALSAGSGCVEDGGEAPDTRGTPGGKGDDVLGGEDPWELARARCGAETDGDAELYSSEFHWGYGLDEMALKFEEVYDSGKRLSQRAYYDASREAFLLPTSSDDEPAVLPRRLVESVRAHLESAARLGYGDFAFFPDMGHAHLFIPQQAWDEVYQPIPNDRKDLFYGQLFDDPELRVLYHTAEQLQMLDDDGQLLPDRYLQWRHFTRNPVGDNRGEGRLELIRDLDTTANTARDLPGHRYYGAGFNLSASVDGCFPYRANGELRFFDLSLHDLRPDPDQPVSPY